MKLNWRDKLLMIGDSITDCERLRPVGEGKPEALGNGYVALVDAMLRAARPDLQIRVVNMGISGNTVRDLKERWETDVMNLSPDWVSVMIGINDVWRQFDRPHIPERHVYPDEYEATLDELVRRTLPHVKGMLLLTPFYIEPSRSDPMRAMMDRYGTIVRRTAERHGTMFADTQAAFDRLLERLYPAVLAPDRVHPNLTGHYVLARAFLAALDFPI